METIFFIMIGILGLWFTEVHNSRVELNTIEEEVEPTNEQLKAIRKHGLRR